MQVHRINYYCNIRGSLLHRNLRTQIAIGAVRYVIISFITGKRSVSAAFALNTKRKRYTTEYEFTERCGVRS